MSPSGPSVSLRMKGPSQENPPVLAVAAARHSLRVSSVDVSSLNLSLSSQGMGFHGDSRPTSAVFAGSENNVSLTHKSSRDIATLSVPSPVNSSSSTQLPHLKSLSCLPSLRCRHPSPHCLTPLPTPLSQLQLRYQPQVRGWHGQLSPV